MPVWYRDDYAGAGIPAGRYTFFAYFYLSVHVPLKFTKGASVSADIIGLSVQFARTAFS